MTTGHPALVQAEKEVALLAAVGLGAVDAQQVAALAGHLREAGLEGPAREAEKLAGLVGPNGPREEQLNAFARLHQMLELVRVKVAPVEDLSGVELEEIPAIPSLRVDRSLLPSDGGASLPTYDPLGGKSARYAYLAQASRWLVARQDISPGGEGVRVWCDISLGGVLSHAFEGDPDRALDFARHAFSMFNVVARRNAVRVLEGTFGSAAPLDDGHPALTLLDQAKGDGRPLVMFEAQAAARRLRGLPRDDLSTPYAGLPTDPPRPIAERAASTALGGRSAAYMARSLRRGTPAGIRNYMMMPSTEWNAQEVSFYHLARCFDWLQVYPEWGSLAPSSGTRGEELATLRQFLEGKTDLVHKALDVLCFLEDPLAAPAVRRLTRSDKDATSRRAVIALAMLGDPAALPAAQALLEGNSRDVRVAVWAFGFLGDVRGFDILVGLVDAGKMVDAVLDVLPLFGEVGGTLLDRIAGDAKLLTPTKMREMLVRSYPGREVDAVLYMAGRAADAKGEEALLRNFAMTKKRVAEIEEFAKAAAAGGYQPGPTGIWGPAPGFKPSSDSGLQAMKQGLEWHQWMEHENQRVRSPSIALSPESELEDWVDAIGERLMSLLRDDARPVESRARDARWLAAVEGAGGQGRLDAAMAQLPTESAARIRELAFPPKKGGKRK